MIQIDRHTIIQVLGGLMNHPDLLNETDKYNLAPEDFPNSLDKYGFSAIYNLYADGANKIHAVDVISLLQENLVAKNLIEKENGVTFFQDCEVNSDEGNFNFYYNRLKKLNLLREIQLTGRDTNDIFCENPLDDNYVEINEKFQKMSVNDIVNILKSEVASFENKYSYNNLVEESYAADDILELIDEWRKTPEIGYQLQGDIFNTVCRGGRRGKLYLRSAPSSGGKSRQMVGDACNIAYPIRYDRNKREWVSTGSCEKVLYIMTEQDPEEIKTMILAYLTGYNEEIFLYGTYGEEEMPRIKIAADIMEKFKDNMLFARIPDPCSSVVKNLFRKYSIQFGVNIFFYDYIFSSPAMLSEYRDLGLQEHVCLRMFTTTLKNLAIELDAFIMTSTQTNSEDDPKGGFRDFRNLEGSKAIRNLVDLGCIFARVTPDELQLISKFVDNFGLKPNIVTDVYKNRRGRWTNIRIWSYYDYGTCRKQDLFVTSATMKEKLEDFVIMDFKNQDEQDFSDLLALYNNGEIKEKVYKEYYMPADETNELVSDLEDAFGDREEREKFYKDKAFGDLI
jgi:replicative DNA helicase|nr:MAG TPA: Helicase REPLICATION [Caudoviricetes sp.]